MNLWEYRNSERERNRVADLMGLLPVDAKSVLDIGARDGFLSCLMVDKGLTVTALDLQTPRIDDARVRCVAGDVTALEFPDAVFDVVFCAEVLEHIPEALLQRACEELVRVSARWLIIGVPYRQDLRSGRTTCQSCGRVNPPWGHVNSFDERRLMHLFARCAFRTKHFVGSTRDCSNALSAALANFAGNPFGTYEQEEPCVHCGQSLGAPAPRSLSQRLATRLGVLIQSAQRSLVATRGNWIHLLLERR